MITRRQLFVGLLAMVATSGACALRGSSPRTLATIEGMVLARGRRRGGMGVAHEPVILRQRDGAGNLVIINKGFTNDRGHFKFKVSEPGFYTVSILRGDHKWVEVRFGGPTSFYVGLFQTYRDTTLDKVYKFGR